MSTVGEAIATAAAEHGVYITLAEATAWVESKCNPRAIGDDGTSFGLYQLHEGGELGTLTEEEAFDPATNANVALGQFAEAKRNNPDLEGGALAAAAQRPAMPDEYAKLVDATVQSILDGSIGQEFHAALAAEVGAEVNPPQSSPVQTSPETTYLSVELPELRAGVIGYPVRILQMILGGNLTVDGDFGPNTETALKSFQAAKHLPETGVVDVATWENLIGKQLRP